MADTIQESNVDQEEKPAAGKASLRELYCAAHRCAPRDFERHILFQCAHSGWLVRLLWRIDPDFFLTDLQLIQLIGNFQSFSDCRHEVEAFRRANPPRGLLRKSLNARLSGQALLKVVSKLFLTESLPRRGGSGAAKG